MLKTVSRIRAAVFMTLATCLWVPVATAANFTLAQVQSYKYLKGVGPSTPGVGKLIASNPVDMIILGGGDPRSSLNRDVLDPTQSKLILGYINLTEASAAYNPSFFQGGTNASLLGGMNTTFSGLYSVQYWNTAWKTELYRQIDALIAAGYDGVFLDSVTSADWAPGNARNNSPRATALTDLANLVIDVKVYINSKRVSYPFYLVGSNPFDAAGANTTVLSSLDGFFSDSAYYGPNANGTGSTLIGTDRATYLKTLTTLLKNKAVFGNDYASPLDDTSAVLKSFELYGGLGWIPSVNNVPGDQAVLTTGPNMFMATTGRPNIVGAKSTVNYLAGGSVNATTMIGGDKGDFFLGGPGVNFITGGAGDDTIYAHPENVATRNLIQISVVADQQGDAYNLPLPSISVLINGAVALQPIQVTATLNNRKVQKINIDTTSFGQVNTIEMVGSGTNYADSNNYANLQIQSLTFQGQTLSFSNAKFAAGTRILGTTSAQINANAAPITLTTPTLPIAAPVFSNTANTIDGGGGTNTVIYRGDIASYTVQVQADNSVLVTAINTAEGPDTLRNVQMLKFADRNLPVLASTAVNVGTIYSSSQPVNQSFLRLYNGGAASGTATVTLVDPATGGPIAQWNSPQIPAGAELQFPITTIENGVGQAFAKPDYYSIVVQSAFPGTFQHVLWRSSDGTLTNLSTCAASVTSSGNRLSAVHSSLLSNGYPSSIVINNLAAGSSAVTLGVYDARDGSKLGTYTTASIPSNGQVILTVNALEAGARITPTAGMNHYVIAAEGSFSGFLQHLVTNQRAGVTTDMTTVCAMGTSLAPLPPPLRAGAVFSSTQSGSQSFLRFFNSGSTNGTAVVTLRDYVTGQSLGQWTSPVIPSGASQQFLISTLESALPETASRPSYYSISVQATFTGYYQHVLWRTADGTLTNLSTCEAGVTTAGSSVANVHSQLLASSYPSSIAINNVGSSAQSISFDILDARDGTMLGSYTSPAIAGGGSLLLPISTMETSAKITPTGTMYHYVLRRNGQFTGYLQHLVNNRQAGVITDMTTVCTLH